MLCLSEARFLFWALTNTRPSVRRAVALITFSFARLCSPIIFSPLFISVPFQLSSVTLANQTESSGLTRLLGVAFPGAKEKEEWEREQEEARRRDHRRIGTVRQKPYMGTEDDATLKSEIRTFSFSYTGPGAVLLQ